MSLTLLLAWAGSEAREGRRPVHASPCAAHRTGAFQSPRLDESSGVVASRRYPGLLWTFNDSGHPAELFATDTLGRDLGRYLVAGAKNVDWEAASLGPCQQGSCLYIADTGDNFERRTTVRIYRLPEPALDSVTGRGTTAKAQSLAVRYPDGSHDVEAMFVAPWGDTFLITKGLLGRVRMYRVAAGAWGTAQAEAEPVGSLPIDSGADLGSLVTDAALRPSGAEVAIRTYREIYLFELTSGGALEPARIMCSVKALEYQGEGIGWLDDSTMVLTGEKGRGRAGTVSLARFAAN